MIKPYQVIAKIRPLPGHPQYYEIQCGALVIAIYAESADEATILARRILDTVKHLYEFLADELLTRQIAAENSPLGDDFWTALNNVGVVISIFRAETGTVSDEAWERARLTD